VVTNKDEGIRRLIDEHGLKTLTLPQLKLGDSQATHAPTDHVGA